MFKFNSNKRKFTNGEEDVEPSKLLNFGIPWSYIAMFKKFITKKTIRAAWVVLNIDKKLYDTLFDYQLEDVNRVINEMNGRALLGHEMGCGKTIISISIAAHYANSDQNNKNILVICPSYLCSNWRNEFIKWNYTHFDDIDIIKKTKQDINYKEKSVTIISYDLAVRKIEDFQKLKYNVIIADESHYMKNRNTKRVKTLEKFLKKSSKRLLLLSGTPATSCARDLYAQLNILYPEYFRDYYEFSTRYCDGKKTRFGWDDRGASNITELNFILQNLIVRRLKKDILTDLPGKMRMKVILDVKITASMKKNMKKLEHLNEELRNVDEDASEYLQRKFKERMFLISVMFTELSHTKKHAVLKYLRDVLETIGDEKIILFMHHSHVIDTISEMLTEQGIGFITIKGSTPQDTRQDLVDEFVDPASDKQVAVLSLKAASTGLNFTPVTKIVFIELLWEIATLKQAEDRINRIGCTSTCDYYYCIAQDTIDERVFSNVSKKFKVLDKVLDNGADSAGFDFTSSI